jgi:hypothetical protein
LHGYGPLSAPLSPDEHKRSLRSMLGRGSIPQAAAPVFTESYTLRTDAYNTMKIDYIVPIAKHGPFDDQSLLDVVLGGCVCASFLSLLRTYTRRLPYTLLWQMSTEATTRRSRCRLRDLT